MSLHKLSGSKCIDVETKNNDKIYAQRRRLAQKTEGNKDVRKADDNEKKADTATIQKSKQKRMLSVFQPKQKVGSDSSINYDKDDSTY